MRAQNDAMICQSRFCPANTEAQGEGSLIVPSKTVDVRHVSPSDVAPDAMDTTAIGREWKNRREFSGRRKEERKNKKVSPVFRGTGKVQGSSPAALQLKLVMVLKAYQKADVEYSMISNFFADALGKADRSSHPENIAREILVKDTSELRNSASCYAQVIAALERRRNLDLSVLSEQIDGLGDSIRR
jgi:hypothetical protein